MFHFVAPIVFVLIAVFCSFPPTPYPDRLAFIEYSDVNNRYYDFEYWWDPRHPIRPLNEARIPYFVRMWRNYLKITNESLFLDIGCGGGIATEPLALEGFNMHGIDMSKPSIMQAQHHGSNISNLVNTSLSLSFSLSFLYFVFL